MSWESIRFNLLHLFDVPEPPRPHLEELPEIQIQQPAEENEIQAEEDDSEDDEVPQIEMPAVADQTVVDVETVLPVEMEYELSNEAVKKKRFIIVIVGQLTMFGVFCGAVGLQPHFEIATLIGVALYLQLLILMIAEILEYGIDDKLPNNKDRQMRRLKASMSYFGALFFSGILPLVPLVALEKRKQTVGYCIASITIIAFVSARMAKFTMQFFYAYVLACLLAIISACVSYALPGQ